MNSQNKLLNDLKDIKPIDFSNYSNQDFYIFGYGSFAKDCYKAFIKEGINPKGYLVSQTEDHENEMVFSFNDIDLSNTVVFIGIFNREHPYKGIIESLETRGCKNILMPWDIYGLLKTHLGFRYWLEDPKFYIENIENVYSGINMLDDEESKIIFENIIRFRSGLLNDYSLFQSEEFQYFNKFTTDKQNEDHIVFVDGGAYDGDSYFDCIKNQNISEAYLFEPDPNNFKLLLENFSSIDNKPLLIPLGLSNRYDTFTFSSFGEAGHIDNNGDISISTCSIDEFFGDKKVDFIKLDIEGNEKNALIGAKDVINKNLPIICLSAYHRPEDIWDLANVIDSISNNYSFYLRQHYYNSFDVVLYAVPRS
tara:strand:+ start:1856 stop:2950 length:1095 start_codon:yes stop_codon:yes gene_type:complete